MPSKLHNKAIVENFIWRDDAVVAILVHTQKVVGSNPTPATKSAAACSSGGAEYIKMGNF